MPFVAADRPPAAVGDPLHDVDTPAAVVDLDALDANIAAAAGAARAAGPPPVRVRPHAKAHKCAELAMRQVALSGGATTGVCCQKVCEAEAMVAGGVGDVLLTNQVADSRKAARLAALAAPPHRAAVSALVDSAAGAALLSAAAVAAGVTLTVLVEVDVGQRRCGVPDAAAAVALGAVVVGLPGLALGGIQAYHGGAQHVRTVAGRQAIMDGVAAVARGVVAAFAAAGLPCGVVTGGGSGTFWMEAASGVFTEVQPGSYALGDADYARNGYAALPGAAPLPPPPPPPPAECWTRPFPPALFLLTQVMSVRQHAGGGAGGGGDGGDGWAVLDSGLKAQSTDSGPGVVVAEVGEYLAAAAASNAADVPHRIACPIEWQPARGDGGAGEFASSVGGLRVTGVSDEHSTLAAAPGSGGGGTAPLPALGAKLLLMPGHCDPFINHFDWLVGFRRSTGRVEAVWRLTARSPGV